MRHQAVKLLVIKIHTAQVGLIPQRDGKWDHLNAVALLVSAGNIAGGIRHDFYITHTSYLSARKKSVIFLPSA